MSLDVEAANVGNSDVFDVWLAVACVDVEESASTVVELETLDVRSAKVEESDGCDVSPAIDGDIWVSWSARVELKTVDVRAARVEESNVCKTSLEEAEEEIASWIAVAEEDATNVDESEVTGIEV